MTSIVDLAARYSSPALFIVGGLLAVGAVLIGLGEPAIGWTIYGVGYVGTPVALVAIAGLQRHTFGRFGWAALAIASVGVLMGVPDMLMVWGLYTGTGAVHDVFMPYATGPVAGAGGSIAWIGVLLLGIALLRGRDVPSSAASLMALAALLGVLFELRAAPQVAWVAALVILFVALAWIGVAAPRRRDPVAGALPREHRRSLSTST